MVRAGTLRHRVELHSVTETADEYGQAVPSWSVFATVSARVSPGQGREFVLAKQVNAELTHEVEIRYRSGLTTSNRVIHKTRTLEIVSIVNPEERNRNMILLCKELV